MTEKHREINYVSASSNENFTALGSGFTTFIFPIKLSLQMPVTSFFPSPAFRSTKKKESI